MCFSVEDVYTGVVINCQSQVVVDQNTYLFTNENGFSLELEYAFPPCSMFNFTLQSCDGAIVKTFSQPFLDLQSCSVVVKLFISKGDDCSTISILRKITRNVGNYENEQLIKECSNPSGFTISLGNNLCLKVTKQ